MLSREELEFRQASAHSYTEWLRWGEQIDAQENIGAWREDDASPLYDHVALRRALTELREAREAQDAPKALYLVRTTFSRNIANMGNPELYQRSPTGTKSLIENYINECEAVLRWLIRWDSADLPAPEILNTLVQTRKAFGRTALVLSGGSILGFLHVGVMRELIEHQLLPKIISGSSAGSIFASILCIHLDEEFDQMWELLKIPMNIFEKTGSEESLLTHLRRFCTEGTWIDSIYLREMMQGLIGDVTFQEAYNRTGRILNVTVSVAGSHDMPRLLNYLTAPNVVIWSAVVCSCSVPLVFAADSIFAKNPRTKEIYSWTKRPFIDGSVDNDMPLGRLAEIFNVNHFVACQVNPHIAPLFYHDKRKRRGWNPFRSVESDDAAEMENVNLNPPADSSAGHSVVSMSALTSTAENPLAGNAVGNASGNATIRAPASAPGNVSTSSLLPLSAPSSTSSVGTALSSAPSSSQSSSSTPTLRTTPSTMRGPPKAIFGTSLTPVTSNSSSWSFESEEESGSQQTGGPGARAQDRKRAARPTPLESSTESGSYLGWLSSGLQRSLQSGRSLLINEVEHGLLMLKTAGIARHAATLLLNVMGQEYWGDVTIVPPIFWSDICHLFKNPESANIEAMIERGRQATWAKLALVRNHCAVELALDRAIVDLRSRVLTSVATGLTHDMPLHGHRRSRRDYRASEPANPWEDVTRPSSTQTSHAASHNTSVNTSVSTSQNTSQNTSRSTSRSTSRTDLRGMHFGGPHDMRRRRPASPPRTRVLMSPHSTTNLVLSRPAHAYYSGYQVHGHNGHNGHNSHSSHGHNGHNGHNGLRPSHLSRSSTREKLRARSQSSSNLPTLVRRNSGDVLRRHRAPPALRRRASAHVTTTGDLSKAVSDSNLVLQGPALHAPLHPQVNDTLSISAAPPTPAVDQVKEPGGQP